MKITILGTGCIWTKRACASYLIDDDIIVDVGSGTLKQLFKSSNRLLHHEKIEKLKLFLITHYHLDHYFDIVYFMWKIASNNNPDTKATIICPPDGKEKIMQLCRLGMSESSFNKLDFDKYITFVDASKMTSFRYGKYTITSKKMDHGDIDCYGYMFKEDGGKVVSFSGDTTMCDSVNYMLNNSDILFLDMAGTDVSTKHYNIIDGIDLMKAYKGKCCIVPCHLTSQAVDYCHGRIEAPKDLMIIDSNSKIPYDSTLTKKDIKNEKLNTKISVGKFDIIKGSMINLVLSSTKRESSKYKMPIYYFDVCLPNNEIIGNVTYRVLPKNIDGHEDNLTMTFKQGYDLKSVNYECCTLIKNVAKYHGAKCLYLTCEPRDFNTRKIYESLGAYLKEIKTYTFIENNVRKNKEECVWIWEF